MSVEITSPLLPTLAPVTLTDEQVTSEVDIFLSTVQAARAPYYGGLKYTAAWWAHHNARR